MILLDLLFPNRCLECNRIIPQSEVICELCFDQIPFTHHNFSDTNILLEKSRLLFPVHNAVALMHFEEAGVGQKTIHQLKYSRRQKIGKTLADWAISRFDFSTLQIDLIVTVPLHPRKLRERGFNQLHYFANLLANALEKPCDHRLIERNFYKKAQAQKRHREQRNFNENLFSLTKPVENQHILIIDDVYTTGNTISAVAWQILNSGNNKVSIFLIAMD